MKIKQITLMAVFVAIGIIGAQFVWFPAGVAKAYPVQHAVNVISAILLGPGSAVLIAFMIGLVRNMLGLGSLLAFPGGMIGAFLSGILYKRYKKYGWAVFGEVFGTGVLASAVSVPFAKILMGTSFGAFFFFPAFIISSVSGALIGLLITIRFKNLNKQTTVNSLEEK